MGWMMKYNLIGSFIDKKNKPTSILTNKILLSLNIIKNLITKYGGNCFLK